ncbi:hypothetical protein KQI65_16045 [bacterium]|nr:hypothetical protein [bacterium]
MFIHRITMSTEWQMISLLLCALMLFTSCASSKYSRTSSEERYPCDELERSERSYSAMKRQPSIDNDVMLEVQERISQLQAECEKYRERVELYTTEYGLSTAEAEKQAAMEGPPMSKDDVRESSVPAWLYIVLGLATLFVIGLSQMEFDFKFQ